MGRGDPTRLNLALTSLVLELYRPVVCRKLYSAFERRFLLVEFDTGDWFSYKEECQIAGTEAEKYLQCDAARGGCPQAGFPVQHAERLVLHALPGSLKSQ